MAAEAVLKYLVDTNRPYSANDITQNLHKKFGKTEILRALDALVSKEKIKEKVYGKQKVYCALQDDDQDQEQLETELQILDQRCAELTQSITERQEQIKAIESEVKSLQNSLTDEQATEELERLKTTVINLRTKLQNLEENTVQIPDGMRESTMKDHEAAVSLYRKRKRMCTDILDAILESYPHSRKKLYEEIGIETDESVGFKLSSK